MLSYELVQIAYPVIYQVEKGDTFTRLSKSGKWIEVESRDGSEKCWIWMAHKLKY